MKGIRISWFILGGLLLILLGGGVIYFTKGVSEKEVNVEKSGGDLYICPMHPDYVSDKPGDCPICGMRLVKASELEAEEEMEHGDEHMEHVAKDLATVRISYEKQQLIGVKTAPVEIRDLRKSIRTVGKIEHDETRLAYVNLKFGGWVEELKADYTGKFVQKGELLMTVYSPQLIQAQEEYLQALRNNDEILVEKARNKLLLWGIGEDQVKEIEERGVIYNFPIYSPLSGFIVEKTALQGKHFKPGENLFKIVDLSRVWVHAEIYEYELPFVKVGSEAIIELPYLPGETFKGKVTYIYPHLEEKTRTVKVRLEFPNPDYRLKPGMYTTVRIITPVGKKLVIPKDAILDSGERKYVFVKRGRGTFEPRIVELGPEVDDYYILKSGVSEGEEVVVSANFLIDSESKLKAALTGMGGHSH
jgi:multidrug efflux pump subunit AcrA (membrane-fusion protein)